jgi:hypothetical protein
MVARLSRRVAARLSAAGFNVEDGIIVGVPPRQVTNGSLSILRFMLTI